MIKINDTKYDNYDIKITWESFEFGIFDKKIKGIAPYIMFNIKNNIIIGIETRLSKETLKNTNPNEKINIKQYLTDIIYEDKNGWISIITGKYDCHITRISNNNFKIDFRMEYEENINIIIDTNIKLV